MIRPVGAGRQEELLADANRYLAGGGLGLFVLPPDVNLVIARGQGGHIFDVSGREFIDFHLGSGPALLGHGNPAVVEAVSAQLTQGLHVLLPQRARDSSREAHRRGSAVRRVCPLHRLGH